MDLIELVRILEKLRVPFSVEFDDDYMVTLGLVNSEASIKREGEELIMTHTVNGNLVPPETYVVNKSGFSEFLTEFLLDD